MLLCFFTNTDTGDILNSQCDQTSVSCSRQYSGRDSNYMRGLGRKSRTFTKGEHTAEVRFTATPLIERNVDLHTEDTNC